MGPSVMCCLALLTLIVAVNARYTTVLPDNSNDPETSQADPATCRACGSESATGAGVSATAVHRVVRSTTGLQLQERDDVSRPLRLSLDRRTQRLEEQLAVPTLQPTTTEDRDATFREQMSMQGETNVMHKLLDILQRLVDKIQETPEVQPPAAEPSSETRVPFSLSDSPITTSSIPPLLADCGRVTEDVTKDGVAKEDVAKEDVTTEDVTKEDVASEDVAMEDVAKEDVATEDVTTEDVAKEDVAKEDVAKEDVAKEDVAKEEVAINETERERQRLELRIEEVKARVEKSNRNPSLMGEFLCVASIYGDKQLRPLLDNGTDVNYTCKSGYPPLILALLFSHPGGGCKPDVVSLLLERGADVNAIDADGSSALHNAAIANPNGFCVSLLLGKGADVDARDKNGATSLHIAARNDAILVVRALLAAGARRNITGWSGRWKGRTPFDFATFDSVRDLLRP